MHHLPRKVEVTIRSFYIFNSTYGQKEGQVGRLLFSFVQNAPKFQIIFGLQEKEKILFYHPKEIDINAKIRDVGLSQAFTAFTE